MTPKRSFCNSSVSWKRCTEHRLTAGAYVVAICGTQTDASGYQFASRCSARRWPSFLRPSAAAWAHRTTDNTANRQNTPNPNAAMCFVIPPPKNACSLQCVHVYKTRLNKADPRDVVSAQRRLEIAQAKLVWKKSLKPLQSREYRRRPQDNVNCIVA